ncbi:NAD(P)H-hydrate dehydratase [Pedobacter sp. MR2016-24]|uniref:NAD(P)H-hydrate dehydratase n=1 Tax=Pedobacter sp. MR2016-24 TaxID=2994466 RepID=UPI002246DE19|nr:NAD(P)H-hydrate dehydratase [Pedobacter sp. MR2016-24]MCX2482390.1 NAD(P)H-hydrate dehydratase [Pedobacter sp. MR2016-24]
MINLLTAEQMRLTDAFTIENKPVSSIDLMESASMAFVDAFVEEVGDKTTAIAILCGKGNNGGDGLAIARILKDRGYTAIAVYLIDFSSRTTPEYEANLARLKELDLQQYRVTAAEQLQGLDAAVIIDAVLGSGLNKKLTSAYERLAELVNALEGQVIAVDVPTGFPAEGIIDPDDIYLKADLVICFQRPKINFFFPESVLALNRFRVVQIGLDESFIEEQYSGYRLVDKHTIQELYQPRKPFSHKGTYGHALIIAGRPQTMGAALLAAKACLHSGAGLTTLSIPPTGLTALNTALPEVMYLEREELSKADVRKYKAIAIGPGLGTGDESTNLVKHMLQLNVPLVIDADALHILGENEDLKKMLSPGAVLTPHMKEFDHLFGRHQSWWERLQTAKEKAVQTRCVILLKNQYTFVINTKGEVTINPTGNPAMAQGGMGDVLTGLIVSFMAQGYDADKAAIYACYLHGLAGDELAQNRISVSASEVAMHVSASLKGLIK